MRFLLQVRIYKSQNFCQLFEENMFYTPQIDPFYYFHVSSTCLNIQTFNTAQWLVSKLRFD